MSHPVHYDTIVPSEIPLLVNKKALDCGCGRGYWGYLMRSGRGGDQAYIVGLDITKEYLDFCKKYRIYDDVVLSNVAKLPFRNQVFDVTIAVDMIEHLPKTEGQDFLIQLDSVTKERIIVTTPNGHWPQTQRIAGEVHRSEWHITDFKERGYRMHGLGLKGFDPHHVPHTISLLMRFIFTPLTYFLPTLGEFILAVKDL